MKKLDLIGQVFGKLTVIEAAGVSHRGRSNWICRCECGKTCEVLSHHLKGGGTISCGCFKSNRAKTIGIKHGHCIGEKSSEYVSWQAMVQRCTNPNNEGYPDYGGKGIKVCDRWLHSFKNFLSDLGLKPSPDYSIDRHPNNETGNYEPSNCRWGTDEMQNRNKRSNHWIEYNGEKMVLADWAKRLGIHRSKISSQFHRGKTFDEVYKFYENKQKIA